MPLKMNPSQTDDYYVVADEPLADGQTLAVTSSDPATVILTPDSTVRQAPAGLVPDPAETFTIGSGKVSSAQPPAQLKTPINCTAAVTNADGSAGPSQSDTCEIDPAVATKIGFLFGPSPA